MDKLYELHTALVKCGVYTASEAAEAMGISYPPSVYAFAQDEKVELFKTFISEKTKECARLLWIASLANEALKSGNFDGTSTILKL